MKTKARVSVAASALVRYVIEGNYLGASYPWYIRECRRLRGDEFLGAWALAHKRLPELSQLNNRNFFAALEEN